MPTFTLRSYLPFGFGTGEFNMTLRTYLPFGFGTGEFEQTVALKVSSTFQMIAPFWFILILEFVISVILGFSV